MYENIIRKKRNFGERDGVSLMSYFCKDKTSRTGYEMDLSLVNYVTLLAINLFKFEFIKSTFLATNHY